MIGLDGEARRVVLIVLFVPSADRDGKPLGDDAQQNWKNRAMDILGELFRGATAMPPCDGVWRDDERGGKLVKERPILIHSYASEEDAANLGKLSSFGRFCKQMRRDLRQGEIGVIIDNVYIGI